MRSAGAVTRQRRLALACGGRSGRSCRPGGRARRRRRDVEHQPHELAGRPRQRRRPSRPACRSTKPIDAIVGSVPNGERARSGSSHACSGIRPTPEPIARIACRRASAARGVAACRARTGRARRPAPATGGRCPCRTAPTGGRRVRAVAVAVAVVAEEARRRWRSCARIVASTTSSERTMSASSAGSTPSRAYSRKPGVDHRALVERRAAVADVVGDRRVRVAGLRQADEVRLRARAGRSSSASSVFRLRWNSSATPRQTAAEARVAVAVGDLARRRSGRRSRPRSSTARSRSAPPSAPGRTTARGWRRSSPPA